MRWLCSGFVRLGYPSPLSHSLQPLPLSCRAWLRWCAAGNMLALPSRTKMSASPGPPLSFPIRAMNRQWCMQGTTIPSCLSGDRQAVPWPGLNLSGTKMQPLVRSSIKYAALPPHPIVGSVQPYYKFITKITSHPSHVWTQLESTKVYNQLRVDSLILPSSRNII